MIPAPIGRKHWPATVLLSPIFDLLFSRAIDSVVHFSLRCTVYHVFEEVGNWFINFFYLLKRKTRWLACIEKNETSNYCPFPLLICLNSILTISPAPFSNSQSGIIWNNMWLNVDVFTGGRKPSRYSITYTFLYDIRNASFFMGRRGGDIDFRDR